MNRIAMCLIASSVAFPVMGQSLSGQIDIINDAAATIVEGGGYASNECFQWITEIQHQDDELTWEQNHDQRNAVIERLTRDLTSAIYAAAPLCVGFAAYVCRFAGPNSDFDHACSTFHQRMSIERKVRMNGLHFGKDGATVGACEIATTEHHLDRRQVLIEFDDKIPYRSRYPTYVTQTPIAGSDTSTKTVGLDFTIRLGPWATPTPVGLSLSECVVRNYEVLQYFDIGVVWVAPNGKSVGDVLSIGKPVVHQPSPQDVISKSGGTAPRSIPEAAVVLDQEGFARIRYAYKEYGHPQIALAIDVHPDHKQTGLTAAQFHTIAGIMQTNNLPDENVNASLCFFFEQKDHGDRGVYADAHGLAEIKRRCVDHEN